MVEVIEADPGRTKSLHLSKQLGGRIVMADVLPGQLDGWMERAVRPGERSPVGERAPPEIVPLAGQRLMCADRNVDILRYLHGFAEPRAGRHRRGRRDDAFCEGTLDAFVDRMAHPEVITSYNEPDEA